MKIIAAVSPWRAPFRLWVRNFRRRFYQRVVVVADMDFVSKHQIASIDWDRLRVSAVVVWVANAPMPVDIFCLSKLKRAELQKLEDIVRGAIAVYEL